jgi:serine/threonine protein kinase/Tfp pilus assembly protein PilF
MVARLGRGGMGEVWRANDLVLGIPVALKLIHSTSAEGRALLLNEVRVARQITHPGVCRVFDAGVSDDRVFYSMEFVRGEDLASLLQRTGRLPSEKVADIGRQLCSALAAAHAHGVLHRDLKPANVLIDEHGLVRITDFGIAVTRDDTAHRTGVGTPAYMAPEQDERRRVADRTTDVYALGLVLYELLTGHHPFTGTVDSLHPRRPSMLVRDRRHSARAGRHARALGPTRGRRPAQAAAPGGAACRSHQVLRPPPARRGGRLAGAALVAVGSSPRSLFAVLWPRGAGALTEHDTIVLADFTNLTGEPVFDGALKVALAVALEQSPFIKIFPDERVREALRMMGRTADERVTRSVAREIAQRERLKALLVGSIASLGSNYVITLEAIDAQSVDVVAREQVEAKRKEDVLKSLGEAAARLREKLGESLASIKKYDVPLPRATTGSLDALHAYALALDQDRLVARVGAIPHLERAIELDPGFALAHAMLSGIYANTRRSASAPEFAQRAFDLRDRVSERERFFISWRYYHDATQDWNKAFDLARSWTATYPREAFAFNSLGAAHSFFGQFGLAVEAFRNALRLDGMFTAAQENLASVLTALNRFDEAKEVVRQAGVMSANLVSFRRVAYLLAFLDRDPVAMEREANMARRTPDALAASNWEARVSAFDGRVRTAHEQFQRAIHAAAQTDFKEMAAQWSVEEAEVHAAVGECSVARQETMAGLTLSRDNFTLERASRTLALCGAADEVSRLSGELADRFPNATQTVRIQRPLAAAALAVQRGDAAAALALLEPVRPYDHARTAEFWPQYLRGLAHLRLRHGREARDQFREIVEHRGEVADSPLYPLAHLGLARAAALAGDTSEARKSYEAFLSLWSAADPDLRPLQEARREYATLH